MSQSSPFAIMHLPVCFDVRELQVLFRTSYRVTIRRIRRELVPLGGVYKVGTKYLVSERAVKEYLAKSKVRRKRAVMTTGPRGARGVKDRDRK